jgi:hypothetical protein
MENLRQSSIESFRQAFFEVFGKKITSETAERLGWEILTYYATLLHCENCDAPKKV